MATETTAGPTEQSEETVAAPTSIFDELDAESSAETSEVEEVETGEAEAEQSTEEAEDPSWLPDTQLKEFPAEVIAKYAKRYGYTDEEIAADPRLARFLKDKINSDIEIANRKKAEEEAELETEEEAEAVEEPTPVPPAEAWAKRQTTLDTMINEVTDPMAAEYFVDRLAKADAIKEPKERAMAVTKALSFGVANLLSSLLPRYLQSDNWLGNQIKAHIDQSLPGLSDTHMQSSLSSAVESVRTSNPQFANMPKFGTPEFEAAATRAAAIIPGMESVIFSDAKGRPLPKAQQFARKAEIMFNLLTKQPGAIDQAKTAVETGKKVERANAQLKKNASLGAGQTKGLQGKSTGNDDIFGAPGEITVSQKLIGKQS